MKSIFVTLNFECYFGNKTAMLVFFSLISDIILFIIVLDQKSLMMRKKFLPNYPKHIVKLVDYCYYPGSRSYVNVLMRVADDKKK